MTRRAEWVGTATMVVIAACVGEASNEVDGSDLDEVAEDAKDRGFISPGTVRTGNFDEGLYYTYSSEEWQDAQGQWHTTQRRAPRRHFLAFHFAGVAGRKATITLTVSPTADPLAMLYAASGTDGTWQRLGDPAGADEPDGTVATFGRELPVDGLYKVVIRDLLEGPGTYELRLELGAGGGSGGGGTPGCAPTESCDGRNCGEIDDGCGNRMLCGECGDGQTCGAGGLANVCGVAEVASLRIDGWAIGDLAEDGITDDNRTAAQASWDAAAERWFAKMQELSGRTSVPRNGFSWGTPTDYETSYGSDFMFASPQAATVQVTLPPGESGWQPVTETHTTTGGLAEDSTTGHNRHRAYRSWEAQCFADLDHHRERAGRRFWAASCSEPRDVETTYGSDFQYQGSLTVWLAPPATSLALTSVPVNGPIATMVQSANQGCQGCRSTVKIFGFTGETTAWRAVESVRERLESKDDWATSPVLGTADLLPALRPVGLGAFVESMRQLTQSRPYQIGALTRGSSTVWVLIFPDSRHLVTVRVDRT